MEKLKAILEGLHPEVDYNTCKTLVDDGIFDSLDIVNLVVEISDQFDVEVPPQEIIPQNFNSMQTLYSMIQRLS